MNKEELASLGADKLAELIISVADILAEQSDATDSKAQALRDKEQRAFLLGSGAGLARARQMLIETMARK